MTMTSVSVIMAVMVINIYNRSSKARRAPQWLKVVVLKWICRLLRMSHDMERLASTIRLVGFLPVFENRSPNFTFDECMIQSSISSVICFEIHKEHLHSNF